MTLVMALAVVTYLAVTGTEPTARELVAFSALLLAGVVGDLRHEARR